MNYRIRIRNLGNGCFYYFHHLHIGDDEIVPISVMKYRKECAATFPDIASACKVVRLIDRSKYGCLIVPV